MQRLSPDNFGASENILTKLFQAMWRTLVHKQKLEVQGKARPEAARRRNSEYSRPTICAAPPANHRCAVGLLPLLREEFRLLKLILHSELRRRAASRRALPCPSSFISLFLFLFLFF